MSVANIYKKYIDGESLTDKEVIEGREAFQKASDHLIILGPYFNIAFKEANRTYLALNDMYIARFN